MNKVRYAVILVLSAVLLCACGIKAADELADFTSDADGGIMLDGVEYGFYGLIAKSDLTEQIGIVNGDKNDRIYSFRDYDTGDFIASMYISGEMDVPALYRAVGCDKEPEGVYIPDEDEDVEMTYLIDDPASYKKTPTGYSVGGTEYKNYFAIEDSKTGIAYVVLSDRETMTLEEVKEALDGSRENTDFVIVGYYKR